MFKQTLISIAVTAVVIASPAVTRGDQCTCDKDVNGKLFYDEFVKVIRTKGSGWVDYMFPKRGQTQLSQKCSYVKAAITLPPSP